MKIIKGLSFFFFGAILFTACFNPPEFSSIPEIEYKSIAFKSTPELNKKDTLILAINFKDGDGDLGLSTDLNDYPYNEVNFYLAKNGSASKPIGSITGQLVSGNTNRIITPVIEVANGATGTLISAQTRTEPGYDTLPQFPSQYDCAFYSYLPDSIYVRDTDADIFKGKYTPVDTINLTNNEKIFVLYDNWYTRPNPRHFNITVRFFIKNSDNSYTEFDWEKVQCSSFDGRFPVLVEKSRPLEGTLKYKMTSSGFIPLLGGKALKIRVQISDNAGHLSNVIETSDFSIQ
jgi:hypothetical protein